MPDAVSYVVYVEQSPNAARYLDLFHQSDGLLRLSLDSFAGELRPLDNC